MYGDVVGTAKATPRVGTAKEPTAKANLANTSTLSKLATSSASAERLPVPRCKLQSVPRQVAEGLVDLQTERPGRALPRRALPGWQKRKAANCGSVEVLFWTPDKVTTSTSLSQHSEFIRQTRKVNVTINRTLLAEYALSMRRESEFKSRKASLQINLCSK